MKCYPVIIATRKTARLIRRKLELAEVEVNEVLIVNSVTKLVANISSDVQHIFLDTSDTRIGEPPDVLLKIRDIANQNTQGYCFGTAVPFESCIKEIKMFASVMMVRE